MGGHVIKKAELLAWMSAEAWHNAASSHGNGSSKCLDMSNEKVFRVTSHGEITYTGTDIDAAIDAYNSAP